MQLKLAFSLSFEDLYSLNGLTKIDHEFHSYLKNTNLDIYQKYSDIIERKISLNELENSTLLIDLAPYIENFIAKLFNIENEANKLFKIHSRLTLIAKIKRDFVQRRALKAYPEATHCDGDKLCVELEELMHEKLTEHSFAFYTDKWLKENDEVKLDIAARYAAWASLSLEGKEKHKNGTLFNHPKKIDPLHLIESIESGEIYYQESKTS